MRTVLSVDSKDRIVEEIQRLTAHPPGNAAQRKKALRSGWQPTWVTSEKRFVESVGPTSTQEGAEIYNENEHVAELGRTLAARTVSNIEDQIANFELPPFVSTPVFIGHQILCWVCDEKFASTTHEGHPICDDCLDHFLHIGTLPVDSASGEEIPDPTAASEPIERAEFHQKVADAQKHTQ
jgi:hypothetical protein